MRTFAHFLILTTGLAVFVLFAIQMRDRVQRERKMDRCPMCLGTGYVPQLPEIIH
jgi:hypothetical protein